MDKIAKIYAGIIIVVLVLMSSIYTVPESKVAVVKTAGKISKIIVNSEDLDEVKSVWATKEFDIEPKFVSTKGLNFKWPIIDSVIQYSTKYKTYESTTEKVNTLDKRKIDIQMFAQYRIINPALYNMKLGSEGASNRIIDDRVYPVVIQSANRLKFNDFFDKEKINEEILSKKESLNKELESEYGIHVLDIGIHRKNFPMDNISSIETKMVKEIQKESEKLKAEGDSSYNKSVAEVDRQAKETVAKSVVEAALIKAEADKTAMTIYRAALSKDLEFYRFIKRMDAYKELKDTTIFIDRNNDFLKYVNGY
ncbi:MAG: SPFH domain-containing protein [Clostridia bacterium]|jgi:membrane protease subunit HflC|nr:SPFH domain-containing protein [Clostridia bacterium]